MDPYFSKMWFPCYNALVVILIVRVYMIHKVYMYIIWLACLVSILWHLLSYATRTYYLFVHR